MKIKPKLSKKTVLILVAIAIVAALGIYRIAESLKPPERAETIPINIVSAVVEKGTIYATSP